MTDRENASDQHKSVQQPPANNAVKPANKAPRPAKIVRKGRKPTAGGQLQRELSWPKANHAAKALITQAARVKDRLEVIDRLLTGDPAAWLVVKVTGSVAEIRVTGIQAEERQLSEVLRKLIVNIQKMRDVDELKQGGQGDGKKDDPVARIVSQHYGGRKRT